MKKRLLDFLNNTDELLNNSNYTNEEWIEIKREHLTQLSFFQHERLIHLIVTITFALLEMLSLLLVMFQFSILALLFSFVILILLIPYISHYYLLENGVQKMYEQYDKITSHIKKFD
ncbi:MAG: hypothetical protein HFJ09_02055 [Lachnospiraceae bacterium]|nr:hypothetical protein [Lachnospiraceae bacterium]